MGHDRTEYAVNRTASIEPRLTVREVASVLRKGRGFVYELVRARELTPVRIGAHMRFDPEDVRAYLARLKEEVVASNAAGATP